MTGSIDRRHPITAIAAARSDENLVGTRIDAIDKLLVESCVGAAQQIGRVQLLPAVVILIPHRQGNLFARADIDVIYKIRRSFSGGNQRVLHAVDARLVKRKENALSLQLCSERQHSSHNH